MLYPAREEPIDATRLIERGEQSDYANPVGPSLETQVMDLPPFGGTPESLFADHERVADGASIRRERPRDPYRFSHDRRPSP